MSNCYCFRHIQIRCRSVANFARDCSSTSVLVTATSSYTPVTANIAVRTASPPSPGGKQNIAASDLTYHKLGLERFDSVLTY